MKHTEMLVVRSIRLKEVVRCSLGAMGAGHSRLSKTSVMPSILVVRSTSLPKNDLNVFVCFLKFQKDSNERGVNGEEQK